MSDRRKFLKASIGFAMAGPVLTSISCASAKSSMLYLEHAEEFLTAVQLGNLKKVRSLLEANERLIEARDEQGRSGFAIALLHGHREVADAIRSAGFVPDLHESALALDWQRLDKIAADSGNGITEMVNQTHPIGGTAMFAAAAGGAKFDIWRVYSKGGDPNKYDEKNDGPSPVQRALRVSDLERAELSAAALLSNDGDPNPKSRGDLPPIHIAIERNSPAMVELLLQTGADLTATNRAGETPLEHANRRGKKDVIELLKNEGDVPRVVHTSRTAYDKDGNQYTPVDWGTIPVLLRSTVVGHSHLRFAEVKKAVGREPLLAHSVATTGEICVEAAAHMGQKKMVDYLLEKGAPYSLPTAVMMDDFETVKRLLEEDPQRIHERGAHFNSLLWYTAIGRCRLKIAEYLLEKGAEVEKQHFLGTTALHFACRGDNLPLATLFVENGADVNRIGPQIQRSPAITDEIGTFTRPDSTIEAQWSKIVRQAFPFQDSALPLDPCR